MRFCAYLFMQRRQGLTPQNMTKYYSLGIDIGSTTVKIAIIDETHKILFADYARHYANIQETLAQLLKQAQEKLGTLTLQPTITGSGGLTLSKHLEVPFVQEVVAVAAALETEAPHTDVAIELGGEDAKIIYFAGGIDQRMNGICAGGTGSFIDQMASDRCVRSQRICEKLSDDIPHSRQMRRVRQIGYPAPYQ